MTKVDLARAIYERHGGISIREASRLVDIIFDRIRQALVEREEVHLVGFGTLSVVERRPKIGRNLNTGEPVPIGVHRAVVFRPARAIKSLSEEEPDQPQQQLTAGQGM